MKYFIVIETVTWGIHRETAERIIEATEAELPKTLAQIEKNNQRVLRVIKGEMIPFTVEVKLGVHK